ncbi:MAG TPA: cyclic nucleotide-binding domain-containing protein [Planctomycetota bacterium]|nr:cyclic nucleotide-binding domain-containing protein [Planctomycetota bacterium]
MAYQPIYGTQSKSTGSSGPMQGQFMVTLTQPGGDKSVSGVTLQLQRRALVAEFAGYLNVGDRVVTDLSLQDGRAPVRATGHIVDRYLISTTHHHAMTVAFDDLAGDDAERVNTTVEAATNDLIRFFKEFPLFGEFTIGDTLLMAELCFRHFLRRQEVFFRRGVQQDRLDGLFVVRRGMIQVYKKITRLREEKIAVVGVGEIFGELSLVLPAAHTASIRAINDSELIEINRETYSRLKENHPPVAMKLMEVMLKVLAKRLGRTTRMLFSPVAIR